MYACRKYDENYGLKNYQHIVNFGLENTWMTTLKNYIKINIWNLIKI